MFIRSIAIICVIGTTSRAETPITDLVAQAQQLARDAQWSDAAAAWDRVVHANPTRGEYWERLASANLNAEKYSQAIAAYEKALELRAGYPAVTAYNIARCQAQLGDKAAALKWLEKSLAMGYRYPRNAHAESHFKSLRDDPKFRELTYLADVDKMSRDDAMRFDLKILSRESNGCTTTRIAK